MNQASSDPGEPANVDVLQALQLRIVRIASIVLAVTMPLVSVILIASAYRDGSLNQFAFGLAAAMIVFPILWLLAPRLTFQQSAVGLVSFLAVSGFILASRGGLTAGYGTLCVLTIQLGALFFGRRGAALSVVSVLVLHLLAWFLIQLEVLPPLEAQMWDPRSNALWLRQLVVLGLLGSLIALGQLYVVEQLARALAVHRDLAAREKAQRVALEDAERLQQHEREQRAHAQQLLEKSRRVEALARVAGSVAHDFNNALTVIMGTAETAKLDSHSPDDVETYMDEIMEATRHAATLTGQLLALGRQQILTPRHLSLAALLVRLRPSMSRVLPADVSLVVEMPVDDAAVFVDESSFDRTIINLVLNARDALPRGGVITISGCRERVEGDPLLADGPYVALRVADNGVGMEADTLERIFEPFFTTKGDKGTGLGLASVYAFVKEAGGGIEVTSAPHVGTTFTLRIPEATLLAPSANQESALVAAPQTARARLLVVDDRDDVRAAILRMLTYEGFAATGARSGDEAVGLIEGGARFAAMCIDGVMPGMSTVAAIERAHALDAAMAVIVCSGHVQEDLLRRGIAAGRYEILKKPFTSVDLLSHVRRALARRDTGRSKEGMV